VKVGVTEDHKALETPVSQVPGAQATGGGRLRGRLLSRSNARAGGCRPADFLDGEKEAKLIALACSKQPKRTRALELAVVESKS